MFKHQIVQTSYSNEYGIIAEKKFRQSFTRASYKWFDKIARIKWGDNARKIKDTTIAGYHYEFSKYVIELR
jgi:hypothetical protein